MINRLIFLLILPEMGARQLKDRSLFLAPNDEVKILKKF